MKIDGLGAAGPLPHRRRITEMAALRKFFFHLVVLSMGLTLVLSGCLSKSPYDGATELPIPSPTPSDIVLSLTEVPVEEGLSFYQDPVSLEIFQGIEEVTKADFRSLHIIARFGTSDHELTSGKYVTLPPGQSLAGYLLMIDTMKYSHDFGLLATFDYEPVQILLNERPQTMPIIHLEAGSQKIFRFDLPPLTEGLHTLVVNFIAEPELNFLNFDAPDGLDEFEMDSLGWRYGPIEFGILIWATKQPPEKVSDWPLLSRSFSPEKTVFLTEITLLKEKPLPDRSEKVFYKDTVSAGEHITYYMNPHAFDRDSGESGEIPMKVLTFWDDLLTQVDEIVIPADAAIEGEHLPFTVQVPSAMKPGTHELTVLGFPYPYYLRWWEDGSEWRPNVRYFSHLMALVPITVEEVNDSRSMEEMDRVR